MIFNQSWWPGVSEGDLLRVGSCSSKDPDFAFLFIVPKDDGCAKHQLQISIPKPIAEAFDLRNNSEVTVTKVKEDNCGAEYVELVFQDQYLGRNDMWRLGEHLVGQCVYTNQDITFVGNIAAKIQNIYISGKNVSSARMTRATKAIYRSLSAKVTIFIQVCNELWEFTGDGERYNEKIVHAFLPTLFAKWRQAGTNHIVTIVFISRVFYDEADVDYAAGPMRRDDYGRWYKDFFKVVTDLEVIDDWKPTLASLKNSFWDFQRDILLTHHYHQATKDSAIGPPAQVRLIGRISFAHDGPILEALNLALNPTETHYIDRSLSLTGSMIMLLTPGTGYFRVSKHLLRLTTTRLLDQGFGLDMVSLAKQPLHQSPIFSFQSVDPDLKADEGKPGPKSMDPLWASVDGDVNDSSNKKTFWWVPFWISISFWETQLYLPFREDRFVGRAKMHQIQMLGLLDFDVVSSIEIPFLPEPINVSPEVLGDVPISKEEADKFDMDIFAPKGGPQLPNTNRSSVTSLGGITIRNSERHRNSLIATKIPPIEESPKRVIVDLPVEDSLSSVATPSFSGLSTSPSQSSIHSLRSTMSATSVRAPRDSSARSTLAKLAPLWLFSPFRSGPSEQQTSQVSASSSPSTPSTPTPTRTTPLPPTTSTSTRAFTPSKPPPAAQVGRSPMPMAIKGATPIVNRSSISYTFEEDGLVSQRASYIRHSPMNTPPREEVNFGKRRSTTSTHTAQYSSPSPGMMCNPSQPQTCVSHSQSTLARRWQHMYPQVLYKHQIKWKALTVPVCLPLTVEQFPSASELETSYDVFSYDFVVDPHEMFSFLVKPPTDEDNLDELRRAWALVVMRGMAAVRLAQGFQFVLRPPQKATNAEDRGVLRRTKSILKEEDLTPKPIGAADVLPLNADNVYLIDPVYLSMTNEIHQISYTGEAIQVRRYVRRMPPLRSFDYQCLMWPKLGGGYTELSTTFAPHGLENYGWNRLDMLVAGYEHNFNESLRYWRTRFIIIPTIEPPTSTTGPSGEKLNDEEIRISGIEKLADQFTRLRWQPAEERANHPAPPVRFLQTTLGPAMCVLDASLMDQLEQVNAASLRKKMKSEKDVGDMSLAAIAKAMREEDGVPIKTYQWHHSPYPDSFIGYDFVSWLVREFRDVSTRLQGVELGVKLMEQGLFEHCRGQHSFLDGHYYYRLKGEYTVPMTPKGWFSRRHAAEELNTRSLSGRAKNLSPRRSTRNRLIVSQSMVIDIDPNKKSDQAEAVVLHHDIIHNPTTCFHFELQWIGTTPRCIEDLIRQWSKLIERHGLKLVEAYVTQISDIRDRNAFQSCFPIRLVVPPPVVPDLDKRVPEGTQTAQYFEYALLLQFGYVLDVEAAWMYPEQIEVIYSYRRSPYQYSQFVHHSGAGFVQVLRDAQGFLFLTNRLVGPGRVGPMKTKDRPGAIADEIRKELHSLCSDKEALTRFYDEELEKLEHTVEEPPPLSI